MYKLKSIILLTVLIGLFALMSYMFFGWTAVLLIVVLFSLFNWLFADYSTSLILRLHRGRLLKPWEAPDLFHMAQELVAKAGIPMPTLGYYPSQVPNAFALNPGNRPAVVAVSSSLLELLDRREVKAVLAHEFAHLKNKDSQISLSAGMFVQLIGSLSNVFGFMMLLFMLTGFLPISGLLTIPVILTVLIAPYAAIALQAALSRTREFLADQDAAIITGDPQALANALYKMQEYTRRLRRYLHRFRFIYTVDHERGAQWNKTHPPTEERIRVLLKMKYKLNSFPPRSSAPTNFGFQF